MINMLKRLFSRHDEQHIHIHLHLDGKIIVENTGEPRQSVIYPDLSISNRSPVSRDPSKSPDTHQQFVMPRLDKTNEPEVAFGDEVK